MRKTALVWVSASLLLLGLLLPACSPQASTTTTGGTTSATSATTTTGTTTAATSATTTTTTANTTTTTSGTAPTGTTTTGGTSATGGTPPVLTKAALAVNPATHPAAYNTVCLLCHQAGMGVNQFPLPPVWEGSTLTPGPWTITPGSDQDHTGRNDNVACTAQTGCHARP